MKVLWAILAVLLLATSGFAQDVRFKFDSKIDFSKFKTYRWEKHPKSLDIDAATLKKLGAAFDAELSKKGLTRTESASADLVIVYQIAFNVDQKIETFQSGWEAGSLANTSWSTSGAAGSTNNSSSTMIPVGSIDLDMFESNRKQLVWRGIVSKTIEPGVTPEKQQKTISAAAAKLMQNYPPKKK